MESSAPTSWTKLHIVLGKIAFRESYPRTVAAIAPQNHAFDSSSADKNAEIFLRDFLSDVNGTIPVKVEADGYCLLHAVSKFCFGNEILHGVLRGLILQDLKEYEQWYLGKDTEKYQYMMSLEFDEIQMKEFESAASANCTETVDWSPIEHIQVLANIFHRPICLFGATKEDMRTSERCFTFLPLRSPPEDCVKHPIALAWSSDIYSHFVAIGRNRSFSDDVVIPGAWLPPIYRSTMEIASKYLDLREDVATSASFFTIPRTRRPGGERDEHGPELAYNLLDRLIAGAKKELEDYRDLWGQETLVTCLQHSTEDTSFFYLRNLVLLHAAYIGPEIIRQMVASTRWSFTKEECEAYITDAENSFLDTAKRQMLGTDTSTLSFFVHVKIIQAIRDSIHFVDNHQFTVALWKWIADNMLSSITREMEFIECTQGEGQVPPGYQTQKYLTGLLLNVLEDCIKAEEEKRKFPSGLLGKHRYRIPESYVAMTPLSIPYEGDVYTFTATQSFIDRGLVAGEMLYLHHSTFVHKLFILADREVTALKEMGFTEKQVFKAFPNNTGSVATIAEYIINYLMDDDEMDNFDVDKEGDLNFDMSMISPAWEDLELNGSPPPLSHVQGNLPLFLATESSDSSTRNSSCSSRDESIESKSDCPGTPSIPPSEDAVPSSPSKSLPSSLPTIASISTTHSTKGEKQRSDLIEDLRTRAKTRVELRDFQEAIVLYTHAIHIGWQGDGNKRELSTLYANRSMCNLSLQKFTDALTDAVEASKLDPTNPKAYFREAKALSQLRRFNEALVAVNMGLPLAPGDTLFAKLKVTVEESLQSDPEYTPLPIVKSPNRSVVPLTVLPFNDCDTFGAQRMTRTEYRQWLQVSSAQWKDKLDSHVHKYGRGLALGPRVRESPEPARPHALRRSCSEGYYSEHSSAKRASTLDSPDLLQKEFDGGMGSHLERTSPAFAAHQEEWDEVAPMNVTDDGQRDVGQELSQLRQLIDSQRAEITAKEAEIQNLRQEVKRLRDGSVKESYSV